MSALRSPTPAELNRQTLEAGGAGFAAASLAFASIGGSDPVLLWWLAPGAILGGAGFTAWFWRLLVGESGYSYLAATGAGALAVVCATLTMWVLPFVSLFLEIEENPINGAIGAYPTAMLGMAWLSLIFTSYVTIPIGIAGAVLYTWWARRRMAGPPPI